MRFFLKIGSVIALFLAFANNVSAVQQNALTPSQKEALYQTIDKVQAALEKKDASSISAFVPEEFIANIARKMGVTKEYLQEDLKKNIESKKKSGEENHQYLDKEKMITGIMKDGTPYALIPRKIDDGKTIYLTTILAVYENGKWGLIFNASAMKDNPILIQIYPGLDGISMPDDKKYLKEN